jgi:tetratricopeptide (TPR) repeat protein
MLPRSALFIAALMVMLCTHARALPPDPIRGVRALLRAKNIDEATRSVQEYLASNRFDGSAWSFYGVCLHMSNQLDRSIDASKKAIQLGFHPAEENYNIACAYALMGKRDQAIASLKQALDAGFTEQETLETDTDMDTLRKDPRFIELTGLNPPGGLSSAKQWSRDLDFLARRMEQMHWNLYARVSKEGFHYEIEKLKADAPKLDAERIKVRLERILAMVGDGHTSLATFAVGQDRVYRIPLHLYLFSDGLYVIGTPKSDNHVLGAKVLKIGPLDIQTVLERLRPFCSVDNEMTYLIGSVTKLTWQAALREIGAAADDRVEYTLRFSDGTVHALTLAPVAMTRDEYGHHARFRPGYAYANHACKAPTPLYLRQLDRPLTLESLDTDRTVYFGFHQVAENPGQPFTAFVDSMMKLKKDKSAENLVIDMRLNTGGDTGLVLPLVHALIRDDCVNRPGHLFVIIGRYTFSAAQNTVNLIEMHTSATFVGEPTGSRPNFVGESTYIVMPYSKLRVFCSSRYWQHVVSTDHRTWVQPQIAREMAFRDFAENRDPCMDAILKQIKAPMVHSSLP